jgi:hypothetical protein
MARAQPDRQPQRLHADRSVDAGAHDRERARRDALTRVAPPPENRRRHLPAGIRQQADGEEQHQHGSLRLAQHDIQRAALIREPPAARADRHAQRQRPDQQIHDGLGDIAEPDEGLEGLLHNSA